MFHIWSCASRCEKFAVQFCCISMVLYHRSCCRHHGPIARHLRPRRRQVSREVDCLASPWGRLRKVDNRTPDHLLVIILPCVLDSKSTGILSPLSCLAAISVLEFCGRGHGLVTRTPSKSGIYGCLRCIVCLLSKYAKARCRQLI